MPEFRKGAAAIAEAQANRGSGTFRPFVPKIWWSDPKKNKDYAERYIVFLNPLEEIVQADMIGYIPTNDGNYDEVIARTDQSIGEGKDPIVEEWGAVPRATNIGVAVELEPIFEEIKGRKIPTGFEVATRDYDRRIRDEDGELTEDTEEVTTPNIGFVVQSPHNFYNLISSTDATDGPIHEMAMRIGRVDENTYSVTPFPGATVDLSAVAEFVDGISYLGDELDGLLDAIEDLDDDEAALLVGQVLLDKRLEELQDRDRYDELAEGINKPFKYSSKDKKSSKGKSKSKTERPARRSSRRSKVADEAPEAEVETQDEPEAEEEPKPKARRARAKKTDDDAPKQENPEALEALAKLRAKQAERRARTSA